MQTKNGVHALARVGFTFLLLVPLAGCMAMEGVAAQHQFAQRYHCPNVEQIERRGAGINAATFVLRGCGYVTETSCERVTHHRFLTSYESNECNTRELRRPRTAELTPAFRQDARVEHRVEPTSGLAYLDARLPTLRQELRILVPEHVGSDDSTTRIVLTSALVPETADCRELVLVADSTQFRITPIPDRGDVRTSHYDVRFGTIRTIGSAAHVSYGRCVANTELDSTSLEVLRRTVLLATRPEAPMTF